MAKEKIRVLIADDHLVVREGLVVVIEATGEFEVVGQATNGFDAVRLAEELQPDVVLIDVQMPGMDGIQATSLITERVPATHVVVVSTFDEDDYIYSSLQAGARGYVLKSSDLTELLEVVRSAARGETLLPPKIATKLALHISTARDHQTLTERENEVLQLLVQGLRNREIAEKLRITERTVKNHVANIIAKLGVKSRTEAVSQALKEKLVKLN
jgi:DNA-binding NarL/FixJ family response regulator